MLQDLFLLCSYGASNVNLKALKAFRLPYSLIIRMLTAAEASAVATLVQSTEVPVEAKIAGLNGLKASLGRHGTPEAVLPFVLEAASMAMRAEEASLVAAGMALQQVALPQPTRPASSRPPVTTKAASNSTAAARARATTARPAKTVTPELLTNPPLPPPQPSVLLPPQTSIPLPSPETAPAYEMDSSIEPLYADGQRQLERMFQEMHPYFDDRESEQNWIHREKSILKLRRLTRGNSLTDFRTSFLAGIKGLLDGIMKAVTSLRTTLSASGCLLVQELAITAGHGMDPMVEILLQTLIKLCAATKKIAAHNGGVTVDVICANVSYSIRLLQHIWTACQDKNVQPRTFAAGWLKTFITTHGRDRSHLEHTGGIDLIEKAVKKGLGDPNPLVREKMRRTFWVYWSLFEERADSIMATLDPNSKRLLENDPTNSRAGIQTTQTSVDISTTNPTPSSSTASSSSRSTLKDAIAARKREAAAAKGKAKAIPSRPVSAEPLSSAPPTEHVSGPSTITASLASAPLKAPRRPELKRPATTDLPRRLAVKPLVPRFERPTLRQGLAIEAIAEIQSNNQPVQEPTIERELVVKTEPEVVTADLHQQGPVMETTPEVEVPSPPAQELNVETEHKIEIADRVQQGPVMGTDSEVERTDAPASSSASTIAVPQMSARESAVPSTSPTPPASVRATSPQVERHVAPLEVYEDKTENAIPRALPDPPTRHATVLEERPNEQVMSFARPVASTALGKKTLKASQQTDSLRYMNEFMARARTMSLNGGGFRSLQQLFKDYPEPLPHQIGFGTFFCALIDYLEAPRDRLSHIVEPHRIQDLKLEVLRTLRLSLAQPPELFTSHVPRALCAIVKARDTPHASFNFVQNLQDAAKEMYRWGWSDQCIEAVLVLVEEHENETGKWGRIMGLMVLGGVLKEREGRDPLKPEAIQRLGQMAITYLNDDDSDLRRGVMACCVGLHFAMGPHSGYWQLLEPAGEQQCRVVAYYVARAKASLLRKLVAGPRIHHAETGLDLCYVTDHLIATSGPGHTYPQRVYRNPLDTLVHYLDSKHGSAWAIWEFRAEGTGYPDQAVYGRINHFPWPDHHPPPFGLVPGILDSMRTWLRGGQGEAEPKGEQRVVVVHCKAGKGRSGTIACAYLIAEEGWTKEAALSRFTERRMRARFGAGVSIPSQLRYVGYVERWAREEKKVYVDGAVEVLEVRIWGLRDGVRVSVEGYVDCGKKIKTFHVFEGEDIVVVGNDDADDETNAKDASPVGDDGEEEEEEEEEEDDDDDTETEEEQEVMTLFRPTKGKIVLPTNDINICFERRRHAAILNKMMITSVAHVWFNAFFEALQPQSSSDPNSSDAAATGDEKESKIDDGTSIKSPTTPSPNAAHKFSIPWEALDGIKGGSFKGSKALDRIEVLFQR
ncbi:MAG: suppressor of tub2 mutation [Peltula sp. TS41687]|nr:MAG: suppressor of tub2 mutation [Peltula sp. TS41687]